MTRRTAVLAVLLSILVVPLVGEAQPAGKIPRMGVLAGPSRESVTYVALRDGLRDLGYMEGQNLVIEWHMSGGRAERFPDLAAELVRLKVDVIVAGDNPAIAAAQRATTTIPIVMLVPMDPVGSGFVASLARPGGNITGLATQFKELQGKRLQLLKETVPNISRVAVLWDPTEPGRRAQVTEAEAVARTLGLQLQLLEARSPAELGGIFAAMVRERVDAILVEPSQMTFAHRARIGELATKNRLPTMCWRKETVEAGCLVGYSASNAELGRRAAYFVDKILKGAKPADIPVEQATKFELSINLKAAKALGLTIPPSVLGRADHVIQ